MFSDFSTKDILQEDFSNKIPVSPHTIKVLLMHTNWTVYFKFFLRRMMKNSVGKSERKDTAFSMMTFFWVLPNVCVGGWDYNFVMSTTWDLPVKFILVPQMRYFDIRWWIILVESILIAPSMGHIMHYDTYRLYRCDLMTNRIK